MATSSTPLPDLRQDPGPTDRMSQHETDEACGEALAMVIGLNSLLDQLWVRGLRALDSETLARLQARADGLASLGAEHLGAQFRSLLQLLCEGDRGAATAAFSARASLRVFERLLSLRMTGAQLAAGFTAAASDHD